MTRLERLYAISEAIRRRAPRPVSAAWLADEFAVSRRTIERDLAALRSAGVPLYSQLGRRGGQVSIERPGNVVLTLSTSEVAALLIALSASGMDTPFADAGTTATKRILDDLPDNTRVAVDALRSRIRTPNDQHPPAAKRLRRTLEEAVRRSIVVNLNYIDAHDNHTARSVEAVGFYNGNDGWYLIGWCQLRDAGRIFRFDRIQTARLTKRHNHPSRDVDETLGWVPQDLTTP